MAPGEPFTIPIIDISKPRDQVVQQVRDACTTHGFMQVKGHSVPLELQDEFMKAVAAFFRLPLEEKMALSLESSTCIRGYERIGGQKLEELDANEELPDQKEGFSVRRDSEGGRWLQGKNRWPASYPEFRTVYMRYFDAVGELARTMFRLLALSLDLPEDFFDKYASDEDDISMCRCHHYPPAPAGVAKAQKGVGAHTDFGAMTLLLQDNVGGLEVLRRGTNEWVDVPPVRGTYVVNLGDMMQRWTNDRYKSTMHRVISNRSDMHRYSAAFFCDGPLDTLVSCLPTCVGTDEVPKYPPIRLEDHFKLRFAQSYGAAGTVVV